MNVVLIGLRGTGKSTCGRMLAERIGWTFVDTDEVVQERAGKSIRAIFEEGGEPLFRQIETEVVREASRHDKAVIASGGGAVLDPDNVTDLRRQGFLIHLSASPKELWRRVESDTASAQTRPRLKRGDLSGLEELEKLLLERSAVYSQARDTELRVDGRTPDEIVRAMLVLLKAHKVLPLDCDR